MNATSEPSVEQIKTMYTLKPIYRESFNAGMVTWRVVHARNRPYNYKWNTFKNIYR